MIMRFRSGATPTTIIPRRSASLMAARTFALPTLARSAIRATGRVHFPVAAASFRMTASTAIASVFRCSPIEGGTTTVAARNRRPHATRWTVSDLLLFSHQGLDPRLNFMTSGIEARVSKVLAPCSGAYSNALTTPNGGIAIFIPTRPMSKRASNPRTEPVEAWTCPTSFAAQAKSK